MNEQTPFPWKTKRNCDEMLKRIADQRDREEAQCLQSSQPLPCQ